MNKPLILASIALTTSLLLTGCFGDPLGFTRHDDRRGFSVAHPSDWRVEKKNKDGYLFMYSAVSPGTTGTNFNLVTYESVAGEPLDSVPDRARELVRNAYANGEIKNAEWTELDGQRAYRIDFEATIRTTTQQVRCRVCMVTTEHAGRNYQVTCTAFPEQSDDDWPVLEQVIDSVRLV